MSERFLLNFVRRVRRRSIIAGFCVGGWVAAALNETVRWGSLAFVDLTNRRIPMVDVGPLLLLVLVPYLVRRWSWAAAAARADERLAIHDRLASFLDFRARRDVSPAFRDAQATESFRTLRGLQPADAVPLRWWLVVGPALLAVSFLYPLLAFPPGKPKPIAIRIAENLLPTRTSPDGGLVAVVEREGEAPGEVGSESKARPRAGADAVGRSVPPPKKDAAPGGGSVREASADAPATRARPPRARPKEHHAESERPARIESERVGAALTQVVDPLYVPGDAGQQPPSTPAATGSLVFRLLPQSDRAGGAGEQPGGSVLPERVTVDFDALPERYRPLVAAYFGLLVKRDEASRGKNIITERSATP